MRELSLQEMSVVFGGEAGGGVASGGPSGPGEHGSNGGGGSGSSTAHDRWVQERNQYEQSLEKMYPDSVFNFLNPTEQVNAVKREELMGQWMKDHPDPSRNGSSGPTGNHDSYGHNGG